MRRAVGGGCGGDVGHGDRHDHPVQRLARARTLQQPEESLPPRLVYRRVAILRGVAAGGVDQDGVLGKPPIAHAGATDAGHRALPHFGGERELQPGIQQRRGLTRPRRTDDRVPRLLVKISTRARRLFQQRKSRGQLVRQRRDFLGRGGSRRICLGAVGHAFDQIGVVFAPPPVEDEIHPGPNQRQNDNEPETRPPRFEKPDKRPEIPDQRRDRRDTGKAHEPAGQQYAKDAFHSLILASAARLRCAGSRRGRPAWHSTRSGPRPPALRPSPAPDRLARAR